MIRLLLLLLAGATAGQQDGIEVAASLNRARVQVGETVLLTVTLRAPGLRSPDIGDPSLEAFEVLSRVDRSTFRFTTSGGAVREFSREYTLRAKEAGEFTIPPIRVTIEGVLYETQALHLTVERQGGWGELPSGVGPRPGEEVAVRLWLEPETAYVGQQVTMTVGAFFDPLVRSRLQRQPEYRPPEVMGFWTADLPGTVRPERRVVGRREYFVQVFRRALFPLSPGSFTIPPASVIYEVRRGLIYAPETFQVESSPATLVVRPLPGAGRPPDFTGAVGRFEAEVWLDRSDLRAGEAVNLVLEVRGSGNLSSLGRPPLPDVPSVRVYEGGEAAEVQLRGVEFAGHKRFSWVLVPEQPGQYVIPELRLPYFDPAEGQYAVARTDPVALAVAPGMLTAAFKGGTGGLAIRFVKPEPGRPPLHLARRRLFWIVQAGPLAVLLGLAAFGRYRRRAPTTARRRPEKRGRVLRALRPLAESGDPAFFAELRAALLRWLETRLHSPELSARGVVQVQYSLEDAGVPPSVALEVIDLIERCGRLRYAPEPPGTPEALDLLARAEKLLARVDAEAVSERRLRAAGSRVGPLYLLAVAAPILCAGVGFAQVGSDGGRWFEEGVAAYSRGDYAAAVADFERALVERPEDPSLLYNLGNAYHELGESGRAVALWVRALRIRPRDGDARFNLRMVVGDDPVVGSALPPLPLSGDELAVLFTLLWFVGCGALIARRRWRRPYLTFGGGAMWVVAGLCAALLLYPRADYAIISAHDSVLRAGPVRQSEVLAAPSPGLAYRVLERRDGWLRVSRGGDSEGWVERSQVELIE